MLLFRSADEMPRDVLIDRSIDVDGVRRSRSMLRVLPTDRPARADQAERIGTFVLPLLVYLWLGERVATSGLVPGDALTRTADASATLLSRDPHLEALGFVWSPIPALVQIPLIPLGRLWRPIITDGQGAAIVSAIFTAWMLTAVRRWLVDAGVGRTTRLSLVALLALHPLVLLSASNGMSEPALLAFLALAALYLSRWFEHERTVDLVRTGLAVAAAYLCRYEAVGAIAMVIGAVGILAYRRARERGEAPWPAVRLRCAVVGVPPVSAVAVWAFVSWAIVGEPFGHFTSKYGNSEQVVAARSSITADAGAASGLPRAGFFGVQILVFGALAVLALVLLVWWGTSGGLRIAAACAALASPLLFHIASAVAGTTFPFARFVICVVPLGTLLAGCAAVNLSRQGFRPMGPIVVLAGIAGVVLALGAVRSAKLSTTDEAAQLSAIPAPYGTDAHRPSETFPAIGHQIAADIDALDPSHGEVIIDVARGASMAVVLNAPDQRDYVINSDRDFERAVADPGTWGVRYLLVPEPANGAFEALNDQFPGLYSDGAGMAHLVREWENPETVDYRLYELDQVEGVR